MGWFSASCCWGESPSRCQREQQLYKEAWEIIKDPCMLSAEVTGSRRMQGCVYLIDDFKYERLWRKFCLHLTQIGHGPYIPQPTSLNVLSKMANTSIAAHFDLCFTEALAQHFFDKLDSQAQPEILITKGQCTCVLLVSFMIHYCQILTLAANSVCGIWLYVRYWWIRQSRSEASQYDRWVWKSFPSKGSSLKILLLIEKNIEHKIMVFLRNWNLK